MTRGDSRINGWLSDLSSAPLPSDDAEVIDEIRSASSSGARP